MLTAIAEGFGPGWIADEACQLALQALRNRFVEAEKENVGEILVGGLLAANSVVYERACAYEADSQVGVWITAVVFVGDRFLTAQIGRGAAFLTCSADEMVSLTPNLSTSQEYALGLLAEMPPLINLYKTEREAKVDMRLSSGGLLLMSSSLVDALPDGLVKKELIRRNLEQIPNKLVKLSQARKPQLSTAAILVQAPGVEEYISKRINPIRLATAGGLVIIIIMFVAMAWLKILGPGNLPTLMPVETGTVEFTCTATKPTLDMTVLYLPTLIPTATFLPSSTPTPSPLPSLTRTPTREMATRTPTPTITQTSTQEAVETSTPVQPTPTETITPSPTIPVAPINVGGIVVVAGTEGLGISLRDGPSSEAIRIAILLDGEQSEVVGGPIPEGNLIWWQLRTEKGLVGWAVNRFLQGIALVYEPEE